MPRMRKERPDDFTVLTRICENCLQLFGAGMRSGRARTAVAALCPDCRKSLSVPPQERRKLWARQLELFLKLKSRSAVEGRPDTLVMFSGGTDSALALDLARKELKSNVVALHLRTSWERSAVGVSDFCAEQHIPLITLAVDLKSMFLGTHRDIDTVSDADIINYPWCSWCSCGPGSFVWWGARKAARLLDIIKVVTGQNMAEFSCTLSSVKNARPEIRDFIGENRKDLQPTRILDCNPDCVFVYLPIALGYNKDKKMARLSRLGYVLPKQYFRSTGSECNLALALPCAKKSLGADYVPPKASAFAEFLSGYSTREEWLEHLIRANNFSRADTISAVAFLRQSLRQHPRKDEVAVDVNAEFLNKFTGMDVAAFQAGLISEVRARRLQMNASYLRQWILDRKV